MGLLQNENDNIADNYAKKKKNHQSRVNLEKILNFKVYIYIYIYIFQISHFLTTSERELVHEPFEFRDYMDRKKMP